MSDKELDPWTADAASWEDPPNEGQFCTMPKTWRLPSYERNRIIQKAQELLKRSNALLEAVTQISSLAPDHMQVIGSWEESQATRYGTRPWSSHSGPEVEIEFDGLRFVVHEDDWHSPTGEY